MRIEDEDDIFMPISLAAIVLVFAFSLFTQMECSSNLRNAREHEEAMVKMALGASAQPHVESK